MGCNCSSGKASRHRSSKLYQCGPKKSSKMMKPPFATYSRIPFNSVSSIVQKPGSETYAIGYLKDSASPNAYTAPQSIFGRSMVISSRIFIRCRSARGVS